MNRLKNKILVKSIKRSSKSNKKYIKLLINNSKNLQMLASNKKIMMVLKKSIMINKNSCKAKDNIIMDRNNHFKK